jgi:hypothetical protein
MKNWKQIPIPPKMAGLGLDPRGFPIPYIILQGPDGKNYFQVNDSYKVQSCINNKLCAICGQPLGCDAWLAGGPLSAFHPHGAYIDTPTHHECGNYAMRVCPYLAITTYNGKFNPDKLAGQGWVGVLVDPTVIDDRPPFFAYVKIKGFTVNPTTRHLIPKKPLLQVEYWNAGEQITREEAQQLFDNRYLSTPYYGIRV